jgi:hypothetical protein
MKEFSVLFFQQRIKNLNEIWREKKTLLAQLGFFRGKFHSNSLYVVEKKIVGILQYAYFRTQLHLLS